VTPAVVQDDRRVVIARGLPGMSAITTKNCFYPQQMLWRPRLIDEPASGPSPPSPKPTFAQVYDDWDMGHAGLCIFEQR
jgi:hypothetical protein